MMERNNNFTIFGLFPKPIYKSKLNREFTKEELLFIDSIKLNVHKNEGNMTSNDKYILNNKEFYNLKKDLDLIVQNYFNEIICLADDVTPYITQSWLNYTETNQYHHKHRHPNSLVSGVLYINCDQKFDKIKFFDEHNPIQPKTKQSNIFNSTNWWFSVETLDIILFPSSLTHMVETKQGTNTRISLAFNTFVKGKLGIKNESTELIL